MPQDTKRINGPETTRPYRIHCNGIVLKSFEDRLQEAFGKDGKRKDGRALKESRKYCAYTDAKMGVVSTAKGSAYIELGNTKVIVSVFDPREIPKQNKFCELGELFCDVKFSPFATVVRKSHQTDARERSMATALTSALNPSVCRHLFPNLQIDVFANVLEDDGSALAVAITAAGLALGDACIPMFDVVTAATAGIIGNRVIVDPTAEEEALCMDGSSEDNHGLVMVAKLPTLDQVPEIWQYGYMDVDILWDTCKQLNTVCGDLVPVVQHLLVSKVKTHLQELEMESDEEEETEQNKDEAGNASTHGSGEDR
uniref:Uncharacterized protein n=1 Tax=Anopheles epiroticus TaxID=199890 RepID=A0A182PP20_9DIPT